MRGSVTKLFRTTMFRMEKGGKAMELYFQKRSFKRPTLFLFFSIALAVFLLITLNNRGSANGATMKVAVVGTLNRVVVIGNETTGWIMKLDMEQEIYGLPTIEIDVDPESILR